MPTVILVRGLDFLGSGRKFKIYLDGSLAAKVGRFDRIRVEVPPGTHEIHARLDWLRSSPLQLQLQSGDVVTVEATAGARAAGFTAFFLKPRSAIDLVVTERQ